jgi:23S rRNA pseudouridine2604 synthase
VRADRDRVELDSGEADTEVGRGRALPAGYLLNKPMGYVTTKGTEEGPALLDLLPAQASGMAYAGRLDKDSRGLVLLLADGRLNYALTDPRTHLEKEYRVRVAAQPSSGQLEKMARGLKLGDGATRPCRVSAEGTQGFRICLTQGRKRQIRRMASKVGLEVVDLQRIRIGPLGLDGLPEGSWRELKAHELAALRAAVQRPNPAG